MKTIGRITGEKKHATNASTDGRMDVKSIKTKCHPITFYKNNFLIFTKLKYIVSPGVHVISIKENTFASVVSSYLYDLAVREHGKER